MTFEEIMHIAAKYGEMDTNKDVCAFAREIIAVERERCWRICEDLAKERTPKDRTPMWELSEDAHTIGEIDMAEECAAAIKAAT